VSATGRQVSATGSTLSSCSGAKARVLTKPQRLLEAIAVRLQQLRACEAPSRGSHTDADAGAGAGAGAGGAGEGARALLPSGERVEQALLQLREDVQEYNTHVYSRRSQRELYGL
jgi:hypothetical protein